MGGPGIAFKNQLKNSDRLKVLSTQQHFFCFLLSSCAYNRPGDWLIKKHRILFRIAMRTVLGQMSWPLIIQDFCTPSSVTKWRLCSFCCLKHGNSGRASTSEQSCQPYDCILKQTMTRSVLMEWKQASFSRQMSQGTFVCSAHVCSGAWRLWNTWQLLAAKKFFSPVMIVDFLTFPVLLSCVDKIIVRL